MMQIVNQVRSGKYGGIRRSSTLPHLPCDGTPSASVWPLPKQTPGPQCSYPLDRTPSAATMKPVDAPSARSRTKKYPIGGILRRVPRRWRHSHRVHQGGGDRNFQILMLPIDGHVVTAGEAPQTGKVEQQFHCVLDVQWL